MKNFEEINKGYNSVFIPNELTIGIVVPIENYVKSSVPTMKQHLERVRLVDDLGFKALWVRDVPFHVPSFEDAGQTFDPFTYLGYLAAHTSKIALATGSIALPLHHPVHIAKSAATIDQLSDGRLILGVASGDRPSEYPAMGIDFENRGETFREAFNYIRKSQEDFPILESNHFGNLKGDIDVLPKATNHKIPMLVTGHSRQDLDWIAEHADGWMYYPRNLYMQQYNIEQWKEATAKILNTSKPFMQPLHIDLMKDDDFKPEHIRLGFRLGIKYLIEFLNQLKELGVNHVGINLRFNSRGMEETLEQIAKDVFPQFHGGTVDG